MSSSRPKRWTFTGEAPLNEAPPPQPGRPEKSIRGLVRDDIDVVFQPILELETQSIFAYEALARCKWPEYANPTALFEQASTEDGCGRLGRIIRDVTSERAAGFP